MLNSDVSTFVEVGLLKTICRMIVAIVATSNKIEIITSMMFVPFLFIKTAPKLFFIVAQRLTACVTCAGAGTAKPSSQKNAKACETA
jgi:hypothetical protein